MYLINHIEAKYSKLVFFSNQMVASPALVPSPGNPQMTPIMGSSLRSVGEKQILSFQLEASLALSA